MVGSYRFLLSIERRYDMNEEIIVAIAKKLKVKQSQVVAVLELLEEGNTVPFIARYRKEKTGALDEEQILFIEKEYQYELKLATRKEAVLAAIETQGKLTEEIKQEVNACTKLSQVEDIYRPYAQKKKTRAAVAIKHGLQPLADYMLSCPESGDLEEVSKAYLNEDVVSVEDAIQGACDIIAEVVSDNAKQRWAFKELIEKSGAIQTKVKKNNPDEEKKVYQDYYDHSEKVSTIANHRIMAIDRAEKEKVLTVSFVYDVDHVKEEALRNLVHGKDTYVLEQLKNAAYDGCTRLLLPSIEREIRSDLSSRAHESSIEIFSMNLEKLLLQPPLKGRVVLGFDPAFRTGCKLAVLDETGKMLTIEKIYPHEPVNKKEEAAKKMLSLINKYKVEIIAIGNGTASRESERFVADLIRDNGLSVSYAIVSEAGASVYSAGDIARAEFPDLAVEERSAVSIGRRLLDPLAELIKIDPKSIGVGQYQHDLPQKDLTARLDEAVMKAVNRTGADLNTASIELLTHISGLNASTANEIVKHRNEHGKFTSRKQLLDVKKLGPKTFEQCAGFLRIVGGSEPLDETSIHPESYKDAYKVMEACGIEKLGVADATFDEEALKDLGIDSYTLKDIEDAIRQPLRDYRDQFEGAILKSDVLELSDLHVGDQLAGTVRNVVDFGAFVDIGLHSDGLVHISHMSMKRLKHPSELLAVGDIVKVYVLEIDEARERIQLSLLSPSDLQKRDEAYKANKNRNKKKHKNQKPKKKELSMDEAKARLLERFKK